MGILRCVTPTYLSNFHLECVQIAVHGFIALLEHAKEGDCALFAKEIAVNGDSVIPTLLAYTGGSADEQARCILGLELLAHFLRAQNSSDYAQLLAQYACIAYAFDLHEIIQGMSVCLCSSIYHCSGLTVQTWSAYRPKLLTPDPSHAERNAAALRVMREYVTFTLNQTIPCQHLATIEQNALDWLDTAQQEPSNRALDVDFIHSLGLDQKYTTWDTCELSEQIMHELLRMSTDVTVGEQVITAPTREAHPYP